MTSSNPRDLIRQLAGLARRKHYTCEDSWYSCPQSEGGSANEYAGTECDCGAAEHNAKVDAICAAFFQHEPEAPTDEELLKLAGEWDSGYESIEFEFIAEYAKEVLQRWGASGMVVELRRRERGFNPPLYGI